MPKLDAEAISELYKQRKAIGESFTPFLDSPSDAVFYFFLVGGDMALDKEGSLKSSDIYYMLRGAGGLMSDAKLASFVKKRVNSFRVSLTRMKQNEEERTGRKFIPFTAKFISGDRLDPNTNEVRMTWRFVTDAESLAFSKLLQDTVGLEPAGGN